MHRILLIEDEHDIADMLRMFFTLNGFEFYHAGDGAEGIEQASRLVPHLILMDVELPDTDGFRLTVALRGRPRTAHIPIIFATRWGGRARRLAGLELGADDYLTKPYDVQEMLFRSRNAIARAASKYFTDLRTGLPAAFVGRPWIEVARLTPSQAIIEITLEYGIPYATIYGSAASAEVQQMIAQLLLAVTNQKGDLSDFIGYLDEDQYLIITAAAQARSIAEQIAAVFNDRVQRYYSDFDRSQGVLRVGNEEYPFMRLLCRISIGHDRVELS